jgi:hypothetical protein
VARPTEKRRSWLLPWRGENLHLTKITIHPSDPSGGRDCSVLEAPQIDRPILVVRASVRKLD